MKQKKDLMFAEQLQTEGRIVDGSQLREAGDFVESFIVRQVNPEAGLRLLCLLSVVQEGLPVKQYQRWCRLFAQSFGHEHIVTFFNLRKLHLFQENNMHSGIMASTGVMDVSLTKKKFREMCKRLNLIPRLSEGSPYDVKNPRDAAFVFGGAYSPVVVSLLDSCVLQHADACRKKDLNSVIPDYSCDTWRGSAPSVRRDVDDSGHKVVAVFFVGGVTYAEISAIRFWARIRRVQVLVLTTGITNGNSVMQSLMPSVQ